MAAETLQEKIALVHRRWRQGRTAIVLGILFVGGAAMINYNNERQNEGSTILLQVGIMVLALLAVLWVNARLRDEVIRRLERAEPDVGHRPN